MSRTALDIDTELDSVIVAINQLTEAAGRARRIDAAGAADAENIRIPALRRQRAALLAELAAWGT